MRFSSMLMKRWFLNYFSIDCLSCLIMNFLFVHYFQAWFKAKVTCSKRQSEWILILTVLLSMKFELGLLCANLLEFITCLDSSLVWIHLLIYPNWIWELSAGVSPTKYPVSTQAIFSSITKRDSMSNLIKEYYLT